MPGSVLRYRHFVVRSSGPSWDRTHVQRREPKATRGPQQVSWSPNLAACFPGSVSQISFWFSHGDTCTSYSRAVYPEFV